MHAANRIEPIVSLPVKLLCPKPHSAQQIRWQPKPEMSKKTFRQTTICIALLASTALLPLNALAMRCGNYLISKGDAQAKVLKYCGEPAQTQSSLGLRSGVYRTGNDSFQANDRSYFIPYGRREVVVENWVFNFGPSKLMRRVTFEDGIVTRVEELDYGYRE
jgi:hypothetical protein